MTGPDKGKGGKYLVVPPGYSGELPDGYFLLKPPTNRNFMFLRGLIKDWNGRIKLYDDKSYSEDSAAYLIPAV